MPPPFWGAIDAAHTFCEPKYATSTVVAEFFNALSSFVYMAAGAAMLCRGCHWKVGAGYAMLIVVGVGSVLFHATMRFTMELCDEVPMLLLIIAFLLGKEDCLDCLSGPAGRRRFRVGSALAVALSTAAYIHFKVYQIFVISFTLMVLFLIATHFFPSARRRWTPALQTCFARAVGGIGAGKLVWEAEQRLCAAHPGVWPLHIAWHVLSCIGGVYATKYNEELRAIVAIEGTKEAGREPRRSPRLVAAHTKRH